MRIITSLILVTIIFGLTACSSPAKKYAEKVGCREGEATVIADHASPIHETYTVECKGRKYRCTETPVGETCNQIKK